MKSRNKIKKKKPYYGRHNLPQQKTKKNQHISKPIVRIVAIAIPIFLIVLGYILFGIVR